MSLSSAHSLQPALASPAPAGRSPWPRSLRFHLPWVIVSLQLLWAGWGVWPVAPVEGDEQGVLFGVAGMLQNDSQLLAGRYIYDVQPGSYQVLVALARLTGATPQTAFAVTTVLGAAGFALAAALLLHTTLAQPLGWTLAGVLACQEITTAAFYLNTSALAGAVALTGVILTPARGRLAWCWPGLALAVAGWLRADSLLMAPACLGLAWWRFQAWRPALIRTAAIAATALGAVLLLFRLSDTSLLNGTMAYASRELLAGDGRTLVRTLLIIMSPLLGLAGAAGTLLLVFRRQYALLLTVLGGALPSLLAYGASLSTPKYFYYLVPFALLPALYCIGRALTVRSGRVAGAILLAAVAVDGLVGWRSLTPEQRYFPTTPTLVSFASRQDGAKPFALVIGPGELVPTADGFRVRTGQWFAPACWHREKNRMHEALGMLRSTFEQDHALTVFWSGWVPYQMLARELFAAGFKPAGTVPSAANFVFQSPWRRGDRVVRTEFLPYADSEFQPATPPAVDRAGPMTYFLGDGARHPLVELLDNRQWHLVSAEPGGFLSLYLRR